LSNCYKRALIFSYFAARGGSRLPAWLGTAIAMAVGTKSVNDWRCAVLYYAAVFLVIALVAALLGFGGIAAGAAGIAKILFYIFLVIALVSLIAGLIRR
jgi:uncharacterized membrane protein YtjA (UPF0391 family)